MIKPRVASTGLVLLSLAVVGTGCGGGGRATPGVGGSGGGSPGVAGATPGTGGGAPIDAGGTPVVVSEPAAHAAAIAAVQKDLASDRPGDSAAFQSRWSTHYLAALPYDPLSAQGLDRLTASRLGVSAAEQQTLAHDGFVVSARQTFPTFFYGYKAIYADHLPLFVSVDSVMHAVHRSYDAALMDIELGAMIPGLKALLAGMQADLGSGRGTDLGAEIQADARTDVDLYLTVARQLLGDTAAVPVAGAKPADVSALVSAAQAAADIRPVSLFGQQRDVDFSQFKPRGHYAGDSRLEPYFRSMIWLGRTDFRFLQFDTSAAGAPPRFFRRQFLDALLLAQLTEDDGRLVAWQELDGVLRGFVGESDNMTVADFPALRTTTGTATSALLATLPDDVLAKALLDGGFGIQRIASQILLVPPQGANAPLDRVFLFFGQRFVVDSQVLSDVVFDRVRGEPKRMLPNPLDVAFGALGNNAAAPLLATELATYPNYPAALHDVRRLVDLHGDDFWGASLYGAWLSALRGMSVPGGDPTRAVGLPAVMKTEPWARRVVNTQLASWAELRHDTLLYAKQSYTAVPSCDFPDAYVDPYPEAWAGIVRLAKLGQAIAPAVPLSAGRSDIANYFARVESTATTLGAMAQAERAGQPLTAEQLAFINQAVEEVTSSAGCVQTVNPTGWYPQLFLNRSDAQKTDPTIADVHTDPADGNVLHVATGLPRLMYVTVDGCNGPRAYAGVVSSYFEQTTGNLQRLTDMDWSKQVMSAPPPADVGWMADLIAR